MALTASIMEEFLDKFRRIEGLPDTDRACILAEIDRQLGPLKNRPLSTGPSIRILHSLRTVMDKRRDLATPIRREIICLFMVAIQKLESEAGDGSIEPEHYSVMQELNPAELEPLDS